MRKAFLLVILIGSGTIGGRSRAEDKKGAYLNFAVSFGELDGPKRTSTTDTGLFRGLGLAPAVGYRWGAFRTELEWQLHHSESMYHPDSMGLNAVLFNALWDISLTRRWGMSVGGGAGYARVNVDFETCLDLGGCEPWAVTDTTAGAAAYQYIVGIDWLTASEGKVFCSYRRLFTQELGLRDSLDRGFEVDRLNLPMFEMGYQWRY